MLVRQPGGAGTAAGAGRIGPCNGAPTATGNWSDFWGVAAEGSWLEVVPDAGHLQFASISSLLDLLCCRGCRGLISHKVGGSDSGVMECSDRSVRTDGDGAHLRLGRGASMERGSHSSAQIIRRGAVCFQVRWRL